MKNIKRGLSILLVATFLTMSVGIGFGTETLKSELSEGKFLNKTTGSSPIHFYVPETIYLKGDEASATEFQYFVDSSNSTSPALDTSKTKTTGNIYFHCADATGVTISCSGATVSGGNLIGSTTVDTAITGGTLTTGVSQTNTEVITWTADYTVGGQSMTAKNYTVCYAPFVEAIGVNARMKNTDGGTHSESSYRHDSQGLFYVSGLHGFDISSENGKRAFNRTSGNTVCPLLSPVTDPNGSETQLDNWHNTNGNLGVNFLDEGGGSDEQTSVRVSPNGYLTVDTSRYNNINQIPNYRCGLVLYNLWHTNDVWYYICDFDDATSNEQTDNMGRSTTADNLKRIFETEHGSQFLVGHNINKQSNSSSHIAYGGTTGGNVYPKTISGAGTYGMRFKAAVKAYSSKGDEYLCYAAIVNVDVKKVDKSTLRDNIRYYTNLGLQAADYANATDFAAYENEIATAAARLGDPTDIGTIPDTIDTKYVAIRQNKKTYTATVNHIFLSGKSTIVETKTFSSGDTVNFGPETYTGYVLDSASGYTQVPSSQSVKNRRDNLSQNYYYGSIKSTVTFDPQGGNVSPTSSTVSYGTTYGTGSGGWPTPIRPGYTFGGWYTDTVGAGTQVLAGMTVTITAAQTLYAKWTAHTYTVQYNPNATGTTGSMLSVVHTCDVSKALTPNAFARPGYTFAGWSTTPFPILQFVDGETVTNLTTQNNSVYNLYAVWNPVAYIVQYNGNDADGGSTTNSQHYFDTSKKLTPNGFYRESYTFGGWATEADGSKVYDDEQSVLNLTQGSTFDLYAVWTALPQLIARPDSTTVVNSSENTICGLKAGITLEEFENDFITVTGDASLNITSTNEAFGTGTKVEVIDNETQDVIESFTVIIFGDVNGDGNIDSMDAGKLIDVENYLNIWDPISDAAFIKAADLNGDGNLDSVDAGIIADETNYKSIIDQTTGLLKP